MESEREGRQAAAPFAALLEQPANNIFVRPQDTIYVFTQPQTFVVPAGQVYCVPGVPVGPVGPVWFQASAVSVAVQF